MKKLPPGVSLALLGLMIGISFTVPAVGISAAAAGVGHGSYVPASLFFPVAMVVSGLFRDSQFPVMLVVAFCQFPAYGIAIGVASQRRVALFATRAVIVLLHGGLMTFILLEIARDH